MRAGIVFLLALSAAAAVAQSNGRYTGCVTTDMNGNITFCESQNCSLLTGAGVGANLAGHTVTVQGTVTAAANGQPRTIVVTSIVSVGTGCSQRGAPGVAPASVDGNRPGGQGGTPGSVPNTKPPQY